MAIRVLFFASLRERLGHDGGELPADGIATVADAWRAATDGSEPPQPLLCAVNHEYRQLDDRIADGDEIAFFPPVTGG